jgi:acetoin utilization deacetylase AcuC-like enzyme
MGFCFFNNAAIAAKYAQAYHGVSRVAVLDFDVHHGNGTEEGFIPYHDLFYGSTHEYGNYPGTGVDPSPNVGDRATTPLNRRIVNRTLKATNFMGR